MANEWMLDLLSDLRKVAEKNAMSQLAEHLDDALLIASAELSADAFCSIEDCNARNVGTDFPRPYRGDTIS